MAVSGYDKLKNTAGKLKAETEATKVKVAEEVKSELALIQANPVLMKMYQVNAKVGSENVVGSSPLLKVHTAGRSKNKLADGSEPNNGWFFYVPTQEQFKEVECHILTISRGFRAPGMEGSGKKDVFNQIMAGVVTNDDELKPFIMYVTGLKLQAMWDFGKEVGKYTHAKPVAIPMFALKVKLTTREVPTKFGKSWVINFTILRNEAGQPMVVSDEGQFQFLLEQTNSFIETLNNLIAVRSTEDQAEPPHPAEVVTQAEGEQIFEVDK